MGSRTSSLRRRSRLQSPRGKSAQSVEAGGQLAGSSKIFAMEACLGASDVHDPRRPCPLRSLQQAAIQDACELCVCPQGRPGDLLSGGHARRRKDKESHLLCKWFFLPRRSKSGIYLRSPQAHPERISGRGLKSFLNDAAPPQQDTLKVEATGNPKLNPESCFQSPLNPIP